MAGNRRHFRWVVFLPAAILASVSPASADTTLEDFDDDSYDLSVQLAAGAFWCDSYSNQYGTTGPSLCLFNTQGPTVFEFSIPVQGFQFVAGAKNGSSEITVFYSDGTTGAATVDGSCCEATVVVEANEGNPITGFSVPADPDLWLLDSLAWVSSPDPTPTSTETTLTETSVEQTSSTTSTSTSTSTSSSTVPTTMPPPPADTQPTVETTSSTSPETTVVPSTTASPTTTFLVTTTSSVPPSTTVAPTTTFSTVPPTVVEAPQTSVEAPISVVEPDPVPDTGVVEQPPFDAPIEQKLDFESKVDVFSGEYDEYVPVGSTITVGQRRTVVAVTAVLIMFAPPPTRMRQK